MINDNQKIAFSIFIGLVAFGFLVYNWEDEKMHPMTDEKISAAPANIPMISSRTPASAKAQTILIPATTSAPSVPSAPTELNALVEKSLRLQGGDSIKDIQINQFDAYVMKFEGVPVKVAALTINLTNTQGESTSFRAVVDSSNGKILATYDHPVIDSMNPRAEPGIKIDPRYHGTP